MKTMVRLQTLYASVVLLGSIMLATAAVHAQIKIGSVLPYSSETPHPYAVGDEKRSVVWQERVISAGAKLLRVHFVKFSLAYGDYLTVTTADGSEPQMYIGQGPFADGEFWSLTVDGNEAVVALHGGQSPGYGYHIDAIAQGDSSLEDAYSAPAPDCQSGFENVACHQDNKQFWEGQKPVAKLNFMKGKDMYSATGWLISATQNNILIANNHNIPDKIVAKTLEATFNYQTAKCDGKEPEKGNIYRSNPEIFETNNSSDYDYTLVGLQGNPQEKQGVLQAVTRDPKLKDVIWIPQHPQNNAKQAGWFFVNNANATLCIIKGFKAPNDVYYYCGTLQGSSGSPIQDAKTLGSKKTPDVFALHQASNENKCPLIGIKMSAICADDGKKQKLLKCSE